MKLKVHATINADEWEIERDYVLDDGEIVYDCGFANIQHLLQAIKSLYPETTSVVFAIVFQ